VVAIWLGGAVGIQIRRWNAAFPEDFEQRRQRGQQRTRVHQNGLLVLARVGGQRQQRQPGVGNGELHRRAW
jgi:hypothetical protein